MCISPPEFVEVTLLKSWRTFRDSASVVLTAYLSSIGGREAIFQESQTAASTKKRSRTSSAAPSTATKRSRKNGVHPGASTPPATAKSWSPPAGSWEDDIESIDACEDEGSGKLVVYLVWRNGKKTKHTTDVIYKKCPQKVKPQFSKKNLPISNWRVKANMNGDERCSNSTKDMLRLFGTRIGRW